MSRLDPIPPADLDSDQREVYDAITTGPRGQGPGASRLTRPDGALRGPFNAFLLSPRLGDAMQELGATIRYRTALPPRTREMAILMVAARWDSAFEWSEHEGIGRAAGLTDGELAEIRAGRVPDLADPYERACAHLARAMADGDVDDGTWTAWADQVGDTTIFELTALVGYYAALALQMRVFRVH